MNPAARHLCLAAAASLLLCHWCAAQVQVTFPLQGYYRPGKYMPVRVTTSGGTAAALVLRAEGAVTVSVGPGAGAINTVVPWLATDAVRSPRWEIAGVGEGPVEATLRPVEPHQVLVGIVGADVGASTAAAAALFPGKSVVAVHLNDATPVPGYPAAWQALDAIVFDDANHVFLGELLEQGVSVVIRSDGHPGGKWWWQGGPGGWFVRFDAAGPIGAIDSGAYAPVSAWRPGWPAPVRRRAILLALVYCIAILATTLWRRTRGAAVGTVVVSAFAAAAFAWWAVRQPMVREVTTAVEVFGPRETQSDRWVYYRPLRARNVSVDWSWRQRPVFASDRHFRQTELRLHVGPTGRPLRFTWNAARGTTLAFLGRRFSPVVGVNRGAASVTPSLPASPTRDLVRESYLSSGDVVLEGPDYGARGDDADWSTWWPDVHIRRW